MIPKENFLDRMEQAFMMLINRKDILAWAAIIYWWMPVATIMLWKIFISLVNLDAFFTHSANYIIIIVALLAWLALIFIQIGILLWFIKYVAELYKWSPVDLKDSMIFGIQRIWASCYTYYYIFLYTLLIPSLFFIGWLLLILVDLIGGKISWSEWFQWGQYANIWLIFFGLSFCLTLYFAIYRWIKSTFAIYKAVDNDDFTKKSFEDSIKLSDNKWVRVFWNLLGVGLIVGLAMSIFNGIFSIGWSSLDMDSMQAMQKGDVTSIKYILQGISPFGVWIVLSSILGGIGWIFSITFTYLFFKRLEFESQNNTIE